MSSFKKKEQNKPKDDFKAYFGLPEFDAILSNSLLKGQIIVLEEDEPTTLYLQMLRYFVGSSYHQDHKSIVYDIDPQKWNTMVPQKGKQLQQELKQDQQEQIAWRYQNMKINFKITNLNQKLPKLDLSKQVPQVEQKLLKLCPLPSTYQELLQSITKKYQQALESSTDFTPKKLILTNLFHELSELDHSNLARFLYELKILMRSSHMLCVITVPADCGYRELLQHFSDIFCSVRQLFENKKFEDFQGILKFDKLTSFGTYKQFPIETQEWGIKASQKGLEIEMLYETALD